MRFAHYLEATQNMGNPGTQNVPSSATPTVKMPQGTTVTAIPQPPQQRQRPPADPRQVKITNELRSSHDQLTQTYQRLRLAFDEAKQMYSANPQAYASFEEVMQAGLKGLIPAIDNIGRAFILMMPTR